ncbi:MAG TPA: hypothetical protein VHK88_05780 [Aquihabitans sp.]|nr:hypothetical protein [Aquihabitans sp.]
MKGSRRRPPRGASIVLVTVGAFLGTLGVLAVVELVLRSVR